MIASYRRQGLQLAQVREHQQMDGRVELELVVVFRAFEEVLEDSIQSTRTAFWFDDGPGQGAGTSHCTCVGPSRFVIWGRGGDGCIE